MIITNSKFTRNRAYWGGGISVHQSRVVLIRNTSFTNSSAQRGGAVSFFLSTNITLDRVTTTGNTDGSSASFSYCRDVVVNSSVFSRNPGGAISTDATSLLLQNSSIVNNGGGDSSSPFSLNVNAGSLAISSCLIANNSGGVTMSSMRGLMMLNISSSSFLNNSPQGAVVVSGPLPVRSNVTIISSEFRNNSRLVMDRGGGAINLRAISRAYIFNASFTNNSCGDKGGAMMLENIEEIMIEATNFTTNRAMQLVGAVGARQFSSLSIHSSIFSFNSERVNSIVSLGGSLFLEKGFNALITSSNFSFNNGTYSGGMSVQNLANFIMNSSFFANNTGGGAVLSTLSNASITSSRFIANNGTNGGGMSVENVTNFGMDASVFANNIAYSSYYDPSIKAMNVIGDGGGVHVRNVTNFDVTNSIIAGNSAVNGGGIYFDLVGKANQTNIFMANTSLKNNRYFFSGGGIMLERNNSYNYPNYANYINIVNASLSNVTVVGNSYLKFPINYQVGGGIYIGNTIIVNIFNSMISKNLANISGNGIYIQDHCVVEITNCTLVENGKYDASKTAFNYGGAIFIASSNKIKIYNSTIANNNGKMGGGIYLNATNALDVFNTRFNGNTAGSGGAIAAMALNDIEFYNTSFSRNNAYSSLFLGESPNSIGGGAITLLIHNMLNINSSLFRDNEAEGRGGALFLEYQSNKLYIYYSRFLRNKAKSDGGAICMLGFEQDVYVNNTIFQSNVAKTGNAGAILIGDFSILDFYNTSFQSNTATNGSCGAVSIGKLSGPPSLLFDWVELEGIWGSDLGYINIQTVSFLRNRAGDKGGALCLLSSSRNIIERSIFANNTAGRLSNSTRGLGGAVYLDRDNYTVFDNVDFRGNQALLGSAVFVDEPSPHPPTFTNNFFLSNVAVGGGTVFWVSTPKAPTTSPKRNEPRNLTVIDTSLTAQQIQYNINYPINEMSYFMKSCRANPSETSSNCSVRIAPSSSYLYIQVQPVCSSRRDLNVNMSVPVLSIPSSNITWELSLSNSNLCVLSQNGSIYINLPANTGNSSASSSSSSSSTTTTENPRNLYNNINVMVRIDCKPAKSVNPCRIPDIIVSGYRYNRPTRRGGSNIWVANSAPYGPRWATSAYSQEFINPSLSQIGMNSNKYVNNIGIVSLPVNSYTGYMNFPQVYFNDYYNQRIYGPATRQMITTVAHVRPFNRTQCSPRNPGLGGFNALPSYFPDPSSGTLSLNSVEVLCYPQRQLRINVTTTLIPGSTFQMNVMYKLTFRACEAGEYAKNYICVKCSPGKYSLQQDAEDWSRTSCELCPDNAQCPGGNVISVPTGMWRSDYLSHTPQTCLSIKACRGGVIPTPPLYAPKFSSLSQSDQSQSDNANANGNANYLVTGTPGTDYQCNPGYSGPLCGVCSPGYFRSTFGACKSCNVTAGVDTSIVFIAVPIVLIIAFFVIYVYLNYIPNMQLANSKKDVGNSETPTPLDLANIYKSSHKNIVVLSRNPSSPEVVSTHNYHDDSNDDEKKSMTVREMLQKLTNTTLPKLKILITKFQIISGFPRILNIIFPIYFERLLDVFNMVNVLTPQTFQRCSGKRLDYVSFLLLDTLIPIGLVLVIAIAYCLYALCMHVRSKQNAHDKWLSFYNNKTAKQPPNQIELSALQNKPVSPDTRSARKLCVTIVLFVSFLVLPKISVVIFNAFSCVDIDPDNVLSEAGKTTSFLRADLTIACNSDRHIFGKRLATAMIFVYPIGIPLMYLYLLYINRHKIMSRDDANDHTSAESPQSQPSSTKEPQEQPQEPENTNFVGNDEIKFLYCNYKPEFWYFEVVETGRRLLLTGVLSTIGVGTVYQIAIGMVISLTFVWVYDHFDPYLNETNYFLQDLAQYLIVLTLVASMLLRTNALNAYKKGEETLFGILECMLCLFIVLLFHFVAEEVSVTYRYYIKMLQQRVFAMLGWKEQVTEKEDIKKKKEKEKEKGKEGKEIDKNAVAVVPADDSIDEGGLKEVQDLRERFASLERQREKEIQDIQEKSKQQIEALQSEVSALRQRIRTLQAQEPESRGGNSEMKQNFH